MYEAKIQNKDGAVLTLTGNEPVYQVVEIAGLNPPGATINTSTIVGMDGELYNSGRLNTRQIVLTVKINGDVEKNRLMLYRFFKTKEPVRFYYKNDTLNTFIDGYVQTVECGLFSNAETAQIAILCPFPYFRSVTRSVYDLSSVQALFEFPFSINEGEPVPISDQTAGRENIVVSNSESDCGMEIEIELTGDPRDLVTDITITDTTTGEWLSLDGTKYSGGGFAAPQKIYINTGSGQKRIQVLDDNVLVNAFGTLRPGSTFLQLKPGDNLLGVNFLPADPGSKVYVRHYDVYRGV